MSKDPKKSKDIKSRDLKKEKRDSIFDWLPDKAPKARDYIHNAIEISRDLLHEKYFESFNFYFSKPINEILANLSIPHVIAYKDYLYFDDNTEYLKRYYTHEETKPRIHNLSDFYSKASYSLARPNLAVHEQNKIILKRNNKLHKIFVSKLANFEDIPKTQREQIQPRGDIKILNNLNDESETSWDGDQDEADNPPRKGNYENILDEEVHNSFQQLLERYENIMGDVSYESEMHDVYNPDYSSDGSVKGQKKRSSAPKLSTEKSLSISNSLDGGRRFKGEPGYLHEFSDFGFSDASDLHLINEMIQMEDKKMLKVEDKPRDNFKNIEIKRPSKDKLSDRDLVVGRNQQQNSTQETISKKKIVTKNHSSRSSNSFTRKMEQTPPSDGKKRSYEDNDPLHERTHSRERISVLHTENRVGDKSPRTDSMLMREDTDHYNMPSKTMPSSHSPRERELMNSRPSNGHINPFDTQKNKGGLFDTKKQESAKKRYPSATMQKSPIQSQHQPPNTARIPARSKDKHSVDFNMDTSDRPKNSIQYIKDLVQKYHKNSEDFSTGKSKLLLDEFKKNSMITKVPPTNDKSSERAQMIREIYTNSEYPKKKEGKHSYLARSKTEDALLKHISQQAAMKSTRKSNNSPGKFDISGNNKGGFMSPHNIRKEKPHYRFVSNEGLTSHSNNMITQVSTDNSKSIADQFIEERFVTSSGTFKTLRPDKSTDISKKSDNYKPPLKPSASTGGNNYAQQQNKIPINRRLTATNTGSLTSSASKGTISNPGTSTAISMPVSPNRKFDFKLNLAKVNQAQTKVTEENVTENSYGFWTSRSVKTMEDQRNYKQDMGKITAEDRYKIQESKDYFLKQGYPQEEKKKEKLVKSSNSLTKSHPNLEFKFRENEIMQTMKSFNQPGYKPSLSNQIQSNIQEGKKGTNLKTETSANRYPVKKTSKK